MAELQVHRFWKTYKPNRADPAVMDEVHFVEFGPTGAKSRTTTIDLVKNQIERLQPLEGSTDPAVIMSHMKADVIRRAYQAWVSGQEAPMDGTPLAAWNALQPEQAEAIRTMGIRTVEEIAGLTETTASRMPVPNKQELIKLARNFVETKDQVRLTAALTEKDQQIEQLRLENQERDEQVNSLTEKLEQMADMIANLQTEKPAKSGKKAA
jgi:hypothetical protein